MAWEHREPEKLERRIRIERDGTVSAFSGKIDFGQGIRTAFAQLVADELDVPIERVNVVLGDTAQVPFDFGTFGSHSVAQETPLLRKAAAYARQQLIARASKRLGVPADKLETEQGTVTDRGSRRVAYADLLDGAPLAGPIPDRVPLLPESRRRYAGKPLSRVEARDIVTGRATYVADVRLPGMLRGAIVRPPQRGAKVRSVDDARVRDMPGVRVIRSGDVVGVVAETEALARSAAGAVVVDWEVAPVEGPSAEVPMREDKGVDAKLANAKTSLARTYVLPPIANAPIGPSAAVADVRPDGATMYVGTHRPFGVREQIATIVGLPEDRVRVIPQITSGTYGRNSHADAAIEAAILSKAAGRPVLLQWTREEEFAWAPSRPEAVLEVSAGLGGDGRIVAWRYEEHTNVHTAAGLDPQVLGVTSGRNAIPPYTGFPARVTLYIEPTRLRTANFRSLAAAENVFAIESFMDELALAAGQDPLAFRLAHIDDARLRKVVERVVDRSGWKKSESGRGLACTTYHDTRIAQVAEVSVAESGAVRLERVWCVVDPGETVNPDGVRNQIEGGIQQSASWTLLEELRHRDGRVLATGWDQYPIATFREAPASIEVLVEGDPNEEPTGVGEPGAVPVAAAIANAVYAACGARVRELPITRERVRKALP